MAIIAFKYNVPKFFLLFIIACFAALPTRAGTIEVMQPVSSGNVKLQDGGEISRRVDITINNNLVKIDVDNDFIKPFKEKSRETAYIALGKLIDASVRFAYYTQDAQIIALKKHIVSEAIKTQLDDGYLGAMIPQSRLWVTWDTHEMAYIIHGLTSDYRYFKEKDSLDAAKKIADYIIDNWKNKPADWENKIGLAEHVTVTGLDQALIELYRESKDTKYLNFCLDQRHLKEWDVPVVLTRMPLLEAHNYAYLVCCVAQMELYRIMPEKKLLKQSKNLADFLVNKEGLTILGSSGQWEAWTNDQDGRGELGESCSTIYTVRFFEELFQLEGKSLYGDVMERTIYNALFAAQSIDGRRIRYYTPLEGPRKYWKNDNYCCPGNYRRLMADMPGMMYYLTNKGLAINLYTSSNAEFKLNNDVNLRISQETDYPRTGTIRIKVNPSEESRFEMKLRIPKWCKNAQISVNGEKVTKKITEGSFFALKRTWKNGDEIVLEMPMEWRFVKGRKRQAGRVAIMRGPVVYCLNPDRLKELRGHSVGGHMHYKKTEDLDPIDVGRAILNTSSLQSIPSENISGVDVTACKLNAWGPWTNCVRVTPDLEMTLTEFADPDGRVTYFRLIDPSIAVDDELLSCEK